METGINNLGGTDKREEIKVMDKIKMEEAASGGNRNFLAFFVVYFRHSRSQTLGLHPETKIAIG